jgi:hypothetical protein
LRLTARGASLFLLCLIPAFVTTTYQPTSYTALKWLTISLLLVFSRALLSQAQDSTLTRFIRQHQYALAADSTHFAGPGWEKLRAAVQRSQIVLVGEAHGLAQVPHFTAALAQVLKPSAFVAEVDPYVAQALTRLSTQQGQPAAYERQYPESLCFYDRWEEFELARQFSRQQVRLVGIDQVYGSTAAPFYAQLAGLVTRKTTRAYLLHQAARYQRQTLAFEQAGHDEWVMDQQPQAAVDSLLRLTATESLAARRMAQDYAASYAIYKSQSHQDRLNLMKRNLLGEFPPTQPLPRLLVKLGANHCARGLSPATFGEFYDVGNLVQNLADCQGQRSLHLLVIGRQGTTATGTNPYFLAQNSHHYTAADQPAYQPLFAFVTGPDWLVVDLRPARRALTGGQLQVRDVALQRVLLGYDYAVVIPETTASHLLGSE